MRISRLSGIACKCRLGVSKLTRNDSSAWLISVCTIASEDLAVMALWQQLMTEQKPLNITLPDFGVNENTPSATDVIHEQVHLMETRMSLLSIKQLILIVQVANK